MNVYWPIMLSVASNIFYHICAKSTPAKLDPLASLVVTYLVGAVSSFALYCILHPGSNILREYGNMNWTSWILGLAIVGLEAGSIYMYKAGWNMNTGYVLQSMVLAIALLVVGFALYKEPVTWIKLMGAAICCVGIFFISK